MTSKERREQEMLFIADEQDWVQMKRARRLTQQLNTADRADFDAIRAIVRELFGSSDETTFLNPPFYCDYGSNIHVGRNCFINYNCVILDNAPVRMGDNCLLAPNVAIYTAGHTLHPDARALGYEFGIGITLGDNVWVGGNTVICPGVHIGSNVVIGAGSVVTRDIPDWSLAVGNPCRVVRSITEEDRAFSFQRRPIDEEVLSRLSESDKK